MIDQADASMITEEEEETQHAIVANIHSNFDSHNGSTKPVPMDVQFTKDVDAPWGINAVQNTRLSLTYTDGKTVPHKIGAHVKEAYLDEYTREHLDGTLIRKALTEEMD